MSEFKDVTRANAEAIVVQCQVWQAEYLAGEPHPDAVVKILNANKDIAQAVPEKKADPYAGLAVINLTMVGGRQQMTAPTEPVLVVEEVQPQRQLEAPAEPAPKKRKSRKKVVVDDNVDEMKAALDALLDD